MSDLPPPDRATEKNAGKSGPRDSPAQFWRLVASTASMGWSLALPIAGGVLLGNYLDRITGREFTWTLTLLFLGVAMSFYNLYYILFKETTDY